MELQVRCSESAVGIPLLSKGSPSYCVQVWVGMGDASLIDHSPIQVSNAFPSNCPGRDDYIAGRQLGIAIGLRSR